MNETVTPQQLRTTAAVTLADRRARKMLRAAADRIKELETALEHARMKPYRIEEICARALDGSRRT